MEKLIVGPLKASQISTLIIIDALDECKDEEPAPPSSPYSPAMWTRSLMSSSSSPVVPSLASVLDSASSHSDPSQKFSSCTMWSVPQWITISSSSSGHSWLRSLKPGATVTSHKIGQVHQTSTSSVGKAAGIIHLCLYSCQICCLPSIKHPLNSWSRSSHSHKALLMRGGLGLTPLHPDSGASSCRYGHR
jgi:hypothetical protein